MGELPVTWLIDRPVILSSTGDIFMRLTIGGILVMSLLASVAPAEQALMELEWGSGMLWLV